MSSMCVPTQGWKDVPLLEKQCQAAAVGVCLEQELDEAESDASMERQWMGLVLL